MIKRLTVAAVAASILVLAVAGTASAATTCRQGDPPIKVSARTSCDFAGSIVTKYLNSSRAYNRSSDRWSTSVYSATTGRSYWVTITRSGHRTVATGSNGIRAEWETW